jgi:tetratricopeptide (TPR) repeat protein
LALFTKESVLLLPALIILYFYTISKESLPKKHKWKIIFAWVLVLIVWILLRQAALSEGSMKQTSIFEMMRSIIINLPGTIQYIGKIIFPVNLSVLPIVKDTTFIYGIVAIILLIIALIFSKNKRYNFIIFGASWFLLFLLPSLIRPDTAIAADFIEHRLYLPIAGFLLILMEIDWIKNLAENKKRLIIVGGLILIILSVITLIHSSNFRNRMNFWQNAIKTSPHSPLAHRNMGAMYHLDGFLDKAEREYIEALKLNPAEQMVHNNLGLIYMNQGDFTKAEGEFLKEIEINPYYDNVYFNFGLLRYKQGRIDDAAILWQKTIELNSNYLDAYSALKAIGR